MVGVQTRLGAQNFADLARRFTTAEGTREELQYAGRRVRPGAFPISIDAGRFETLAASAAVIRRAREFREQLGSSRKIVLGIDRMDYTKGIEIRLTAYQELLRAGKTRVEDSVFVQVAVPTRETVAEYQALRAQVEGLVGEINGEFGNLALTPVHYLHRGLDREELVALYLAADVMVVTPLRDGMNLVAKEYVASRLENTGVLVLSEFTGAAYELQSALLVNPHDIDGLVVKLDAALHMPSTEQQRRMRALRRVIQRHDVFRWADLFLRELSAG